jgi:hypothetical protein
MAHKAVLSCLLLALSLTIGANSEALDDKWLSLEFRLDTVVHSIHALLMVDACTCVQHLQRTAMRR